MGPIFVQIFGGWWLNLASIVAAVTHQKKVTELRIFSSKKSFFDIKFYFSENISNKLFECQIWTDNSKNWSS